MSYNIELHPLAVQELRESYQWYEEQRAGLGARFIASFNKRLKEIKKQPERYVKKKGNYREALIEVFPYLIIYEVLKEDQIIFISYIFHTKRNPRLKYKR